MGSTGLVVASRRLARAVLTVFNGKTATNTSIVSMMNAFISSAWLAFVLSTKGLYSGLYFDTVWSNKCEWESFYYEASTSTFGACAFLLGSGLSCESNAQLSTLQKRLDELCASIPILLALASVERT